MDPKYLLLRLKLFRREYLAATSARLKYRWLWLWNLILEVCFYLFQGEQNQIRHLENAIKQKDNYIRFLQSGLINKKDVTEVHHPSPLENTAHFLFLPIVVIGFLLKKFYRFFTLRKYTLLIYSGENENVRSQYSGNGSRLFLRPSDNKSWPGGLVVFRYRIEAVENRYCPVLYVDPGTGFTQEYSIPLPAGADGVHEQIIELPPKLHALEFTLEGKYGGEYSLSDVSLKETNVVLAAWYLYHKHSLTPAQAVHTAVTRRMPGIRRPRLYMGSYNTWIQKYDTLTGLDYKAISSHINAMPNPPLLCVIIDADQGNIKGLTATIQSIKSQLYPNWEILLMTAAGDSFSLAKLSAFEKDKRIRLITRDKGDGLSVIVTQTEGQFIGFVDCGDLLSRHALYMMAAKITDDENIRILYSDHDCIDDTGLRHSPCFKPDWNYDLFLGKNYLQQFVIYKKDLLSDRLGSGNNPAGHCDLPYLLIDGNDDGSGIAHVPFVLYHRKSCDCASDCEITSPETVQRHLNRAGQIATALANPLNDQLVRVTYPITSPPPLVTLIILTRNSLRLIANCVQGILENTDYDNLDVIIIDNGSDEEDTLRYLETVNRDPRVRVIPRPGAFNFSALNNYAVTQARGEIIGLINNDISVIEPGWLREMVSHMERPGIGIVGAKLLYANDTIQHAGVVLGPGGVAGHAFRHFPRFASGQCDRLLLTQELSCVTGACLLTRKSIYDEVGGLDEINMSITYNDLDYCLKVHDAKYRIIWTPYAELYHLESASRGSDLAPENLERWQREYDHAKKKWAAKVRSDPYYNPNLTNAEEDFSLAFPPRALKPWEHYI